MVGSSVGLDLKTKKAFEIQKHGAFLAFEYVSLHTWGSHNRCLHVVLLPKMSEKHKYENKFS
jgi:hypothetical protein